MQVRIRRPQAGGPAGASENAEYILRRLRLTIGRGSTQDLQIPDPAAALRHAIMRPRSGRLEIQAYPRCTFAVNGVNRVKATLAEGDVVRIGNTSIVVQQARPSAPVVLEVQAAATAAEPAHTHTTTLRAAGLSVRFWSWLAALAVIAIFLIPPLSAAMYAPARPALRTLGLLPGDRLWEAGPLHESHRFIGNDCNACHVQPFQRVRNEQCTACHAEVQHHVSVGSKDVALFQEHRCGACHEEHDEPGVLVQRDPRLCTDCHGRLDSLKKDTTLTNVTDFATGHPEFRPTILQPVPAKAGASNWVPTRAPARGAPAREYSGLTFAHADHLKPEGIKSPRGYEVMQCQDCHQPEPGGQLMAPIRMESHCARCHSLLFDENDPRSTVPHGDLPGVFNTLEAHFIRGYLDSHSSAPSATRARRPGREAEIMTREEQRLAKDWATRQTLLVANELLGKRVCVECHQVTRDPTQTGYAQWRVAPVRITENWMPSARFSHASHSTTPCKTCHTAAPASKASSDVLMPSIQTCRQCHGDAHDQTRLASDCGMCHGFHLPGRGLLDPASALPASRSGTMK